MDTTPPPPPPALASEVPASEDKTVAILSYLTLIGFIVAVVLHGNKKTKLGTFHLRQTLGLFLTLIAGLVLLMCIPVIGWFGLPVIWLGFLVLWIIGFIAAASGQCKPVPLLGEQYQKWFGKTFE